MVLVDLLRVLGEFHRVAGAVGVEGPQHVVIHARQGRRRGHSEDCAKIAEVLENHELKQDITGCKAKH